MTLRMLDSHLNVPYLKQYGNGKHFVETGTYRGDTVFVALEARMFDTIDSIELDKTFFDTCRKIFEGDKRVEIWHGDSIDCLPKILAKIENNPCTFWLDAHASGPLRGGKSGGSPLLDELSIIKSHGCQEHTIFIDDKRLFGSSEWSGITQDQAMGLLLQINPKYKFYLLDGQVEKDIICATVINNETT
jgi:hypothetical protein